MLVFGTVKEQNTEDYTVKIELSEYDGFVTNWLKVVQKNTQNDKDGYLPNINGLVAAILDDDMSDGVVLGSIY